MKKLLAMTALALLATTATAFAQPAAILGEPQPVFPAPSGPVLNGPTLVVPEPAPEFASGPTYAPGPIGPGPLAPAIPLFHNVKYKDLRKVPACAVPLVIEVKDPCWKGSRHCAPPTVAVEVRVPPCATPKVTGNKDGSKLKYDFGEFEIEITSRRGLVTVDYDG